MQYFLGILLALTFGVCVVAVYIAVSYYQAHKRRTALQRKLLRKIHAAVKTQMHQA
jgi:hypothetical protein